MLIKLYLGFFFAGLSFAISTGKFSKCIQNCVASTKCTQQERQPNKCNHKAIIKSFHKCISSCTKTYVDGFKLANYAHQKSKKKNVNNKRNKQKRLKRGLKSDKTDGMGKRMDNTKRQFREIIPPLRSQGFANGLNRLNRNANIESFKQRRDKLETLLLHGGKQNRTIKGNVTKKNATDKHVTKKYATDEHLVTEEHVTKKYETGEHVTKNYVVKKYVTDRKIKSLLPNENGNNYMGASSLGFGFSPGGSSNVSSRKAQNSKCFQNCLTSTKCTPLEGHLHSCSHKASLERYLKCISSCERNIPNGHAEHQELKKQFVEDSEKRTNRGMVHLNSASVYKQIIESRKARFKNIKSPEDKKTEGNVKVSTAKSSGNNAASDQKRLKRSLTDDLEKQVYNIKKRLTKIIPDLKSKDYYYDDLIRFNRNANIETLIKDRIMHEELHNGRKRNRKDIGSNGHETKRKGKREITNENGNSYVQANKRSVSFSPSPVASNSLHAGVKLRSSGISANVQRNSNVKAGHKWTEFGYPE